MMDTKLNELSSALMPFGIVGVSVGDWSDKTTWKVWREGSGELSALDDQGISSFVTTYDPEAQKKTTVLSQDLMAQFTTDDATKIQAAISGNVQFWLLWSALQAQSEPMWVTNDRFLKGWSALVQVLGQPRMDAIASALGVKIS